MSISINNTNEPQFNMSVKKLRLELTRAVLGKANWADLHNDYLRDLLDITGLDDAAANEFRMGIAFRFYRDGTEVCVQLTQEQRGVELLLSWDIGLA